MKTGIKLFAILLGFILTACNNDLVDRIDTQNLLMGKSYVATTPWDADGEREFSAWVERLGTARQQKRCISLSKCLKDPSANSLYSNEDRSLNVFADCADLPVILRAYFSYKTNRPFSYVSRISGRHYTVGNKPTGHRNYTSFPNISRMFVQIANSVHSGFYRTAPEVENTYTYPVDVNRETVRPGTVFYDPNGHVLVVYKVENDGTVRMMDGHPDNSLTIKRFNESFAKGKPSNGGGFRAWRKYRIEGDHSAGNLRIVRDSNSRSKGYSRTAQFRRNYTLPNGKTVNYYKWIRFKLSKSGSKVDPIKEFKERLDQLCIDIEDRINSVNKALQKGIAAKAHPNRLPKNIYGTTGEWETWSTPSRDARLKASFDGFYKFVNESATTVEDSDSSYLYTLGGKNLVREFLDIWDNKVTTPACNFHYKNSARSSIPISFETVMDRMWKLSFDPYHCPELRWGASIGSSEFSTCPDNSNKLSWYENEQRLRNNFERDYNATTTLDFGPTTHADVDILNLLHYLIDTLPEYTPAPTPEPTPVDPTPVSENNNGCNERRLNICLDFGGGNACYEKWNCTQ